MKAKKTSTKKATVKRVAAKKSVVSHTPVAQTTRSTSRKHKLSDTTLMLLALFFSVAALFIVMLHQQQTEQFQRYMDGQMLQRDSQYVPGTGMRETAPVKTGMRR